MVNSDVIINRSRGAIGAFVMFALPILLITILGFTMKPMNGYQSIKVILVQNVSYQDLSGNLKILSKGAVVDMYVIPSKAFTTDIRGRSVSSKDPSYIGVIGYEYFDLSSGEFKTVD